MNDWPKAVTTASIWVSTGFALGFGLFKMNFSGGGAAFLMVVLTGMVIGGAAGATLAVWRAKPSGNERQDGH